MIPRPRKQISLLIPLQQCNVMKKAVIVDILKLIVIFGVIWWLVSLIPFGKIKSDALEISIENEEKLGDLIVENIILSDSKNLIVKNPKVDSAVYAITSRLLKNIGTTDYEYKFYVIQNEEINAFTLPGGNIFIHTGLIKFSEHPEEVAAVLAHEIGHAEKKHVVKKLVKELGISLLFSVLTGGDQVLLGEISRVAASTAFDRGQEGEADDYALSLMEKSKVSPTSLAVFFRRLNDKYGTYNSSMEILMTHPNNNSRIKKSLEYKPKPGFSPEEFKLNWDSVKEQIAEDKPL